MTAPVVRCHMFLRELFQSDCAGLDFGISCSVPTLLYITLISRPSLPSESPSWVIAKEHRD